MKRTILSLMIIVLVVTAIRIPLLGIPFERDEGEYAYIAWRLGHQELPYRDWIDQKPPAIFWTYELALNLPLESVRAVHLLGLLWTAASAGALFLLAIRFMKAPWAMAAAMLFALLSAQPSLEGTAANTELFLLLPLILSQIAFFRATEAEKRGILFMMLAGALTGLAAAFKQVAAVNWFFLLAMYPVFRTGERRLRQTVSFGVWSAAGAGMVWGVIAAYFYLRHGLAEFTYNVFTHNLEYIQSMPGFARRANLRMALTVISPAQGVVWIFSAAGFITLLATKRMKWWLFLAGWLVTSMMGVGASGYFFPHYFQQLLPVLCLAAGLGAEALDDARWWKNVPAWGRRMVLVGALAVPPVVAIYPFWFSYSPEEAVNKIYPDNAFAEMRVLGNRIAQITRPDDRVFVFGSEPEVLFYAQRVSATRYIFLNPLYGSYADAREKQTAAANEISAHQPAVVLYHPTQLFFVPGSEQYFTHWTQSYVQTNFRTDTDLTRDAAGGIHVITGMGNQEPAVPSGEQVVGIVFARSKGEHAPDNAK
jgi:hypothetical protein